MSRVLVGMSGGVDSAATALILKNKGYDVTGVTLKLWGKCDGADAAEVADALGIEHIILDGQELFKKEVQTEFAKSYIKGETPNPCICCNRGVKFRMLLDMAKEQGFDFIATGHYARTEQENGEFVIKKGTDAKKDQSYVLCRLDRQEICKILFPLGIYNKEEIRAIVADAGLSVAKKADSQEICFIPDNDYAGFVERFTGMVPPCGDIVDKEGNVLGRHAGIHRYTIGQRKGLGAFSKPMFVTGINAIDNTVIIGEKGEEYSDRMTVRDINILSDAFLKSELLEVKVRYAAPPVKARVILKEGGAEVLFESPCRAITPGQSAAFYVGDTLAGGGIICGDDRII